MDYGVVLFRIKELFDIIVEYPDSKPAIEDLKVYYSSYVSSHLMCLSGVPESSRTESTSHGIFKTIVSKPIPY